MAWITGRCGVYRVSLVDQACSPFSTALYDVIAQSLMDRSVFFASCLPTGLSLNCAW